MGKRLRRSYLVERGIQLRYAGTILFVAFVAAAASGMVVFYTSWHILGEKLYAIYPQGLFVYTLNKAVIALVKNLSLLAVMLFLLGIVASHRIAGPITRIKRMIRNMGEGRLGEPISLRRTDELRDLTEELDIMREKMNSLLNAGGTKK